MFNIGDLIVVRNYENYNGFLKQHSGYKTRLLGRRAEGQWYITDINGNHNYLNEGEFDLVVTRKQISVTRRTL